MNGHPEELNRANGLLEISYSFKRSGTMVDHIFQQKPLRVLFPRIHTGVHSSVLINSSGGVAGGDQLKVHIQTQENTRALMTTQAAEKIYKSSSSPSLLSTVIDLKPHSWYEWMPQETIIFNEAKLDRETSLHVASGSTLMAGEIVIFGRTASLEELDSISLQDSWSVYFSKQLIWRDVLKIEKDTTKEILTNRMCFDGANVAATLIVVSDTASQLKKAFQIPQICRSVRLSVSAFDHILIIKMLSKNGEELRKSYLTIWKHLRSYIDPQLPCISPRMWML